MTRDDGSIRDKQLAHRAPILTYVIYTDDLVIFREANEGEM
jgi:hypothetical protein